MTDFRQEAAAIDEYNRALLQAAQDGAVAEAEREVGLSWVVELARIRHATQTGLACARAECRDAWAAVQAGRGGDPAPAQRRLGRAESDLRRSAETARQVLAVVTGELDLMAAAEEERQATARAGRDRLRLARRRAFGTCAGPADG
jgi:hypothetical protein